MRKFILRLISNLLVIAITLSPLSNLNLSIWADTVIDDSVFDEILAVDDPVQDAKFDWGVGNIAGDWNKATKNDHLAWNYFHNQVQNHIRNDRNNRVQPIELTITFTEGAKAGKTGRADLFREIEGTGETYIWEIKPLSYATEKRLPKVAAQLASYVESDENYRYGNTNGVNITGTTFTSDNGLYNITYVCEHNGLIFYWFERIEEEKKPDEGEADEEPKTNSEPESDSNPPNDEPKIEDNSNENPDADKEDDKNEDDDDTTNYNPFPYWIFFPFLFGSGNGGNNDSDSGDGDINITHKKTQDDFNIAAFIPTLEPSSQIITYYWFGKTKDIPDSYSYSPTEQPPLTFDSYGNVVSGARIIIPVATIGVLSLIAATAVRDHSGSTGKNTASPAIVSVSGNFLTRVRNAITTNNPDELIAAYNEFIPYINVLDVSHEDIYGLTLEELLEKLDEILSEIIEKIQGNSDEYSEAEASLPPSDPLIIDFGSDGIELHSIENGVNFDLDNNGFAEKTAWIGTEDGFLALDRNNNKKFDNGSELFGDKVTLKSGLTATSGFEALAELDTNGDKTIDVFDSDFSKLYVWFDKNHNGVSEAGEFKTLSEVNVKSISLLTETSNIIDDETEMRIAESADVTITEAGKTKTTKISEFWFPVDLSDTTRNGETTTGNVPSLYEALENDNTGLLSDLWNEFCNSSDYIQKRYLNKQILYTITNSNDIAKNSRGGNIDARDLHVIEQFMGRKFVGIGGTDPNTNAAVILENIIIDIEEKYYTTLNLYSSLGGYLSGVFEYEDENGNKYLNLALLYDFINSNENEGKNMDCLIYDLSIYLKTFDEINNTNYSKSNFEYFNSKDNRYSFIFNYTELSDSYIGTSLDEIYNGSNGNDLIFTENGNDILYGRNGNDYLDGGYGNDILQGGEGNDTYVYGKGCGNDTIFDNTGYDKIKFVGLSPSDFTVYYPANTHEAILTVTETGETLTIQYFRSYNLRETLVLEFEDGNIMKLDDLNSPFLNIIGREDTKSLIIFYGNSIAKVIGSACTVNGSDGNDTIYGGDNNDILYGRNGNDYLDGGYGNDILQGGEGDDTYIYGKGYGNDTIFDSTGYDKIKFVGLSPSDFTVYYPSNSYEAILTVTETGETLTIQYFRSYNLRETLVLEFEDGNIMKLDDLNSPFLNIIGREDTKSLIIFYENSIAKVIGSACTVNGSAGNDTIYGGDNNDILYGRNGNDYLDGGYGNDILQGGEGDDTYIYGKGYGNDTIFDSTGYDKIKFVGLSPSDFTVYYPANTHEAILTVTETGETLTIQYFRSYNLRETLVLEFEDGNIMKLDDHNSPFLNIIGRKDTKSLIVFYGNSIAKVVGQDCIVNGSAGNDTIYGGDNNDTLYGRNGNDYLDGGYGDDILQGGEGDDTYVYGKDYGNDTISDNLGTNKIRIIGLSASDFTVHYPSSNYNAVLTIIETGEILIIQNFRYSDTWKNFIMEFEDGSTIKIEDLAVI